MFTQGSRLTFWVTCPQGKNCRCFYFAQIAHKIISNMARLMCYVHVSKTRCDRRANWGIIS